GLALAALVLAFPEDDAPRWTFLFLLACEALVRVLRNHEGRLLAVLKWTRLIARVSLALAAVMFAVQQMRHGIYPALERESSFSVPMFGAAGEPAATGIAVNLPQTVNEPPPAAPAVLEEAEKRPAPKEKAAGDETSRLD